MSQKGSLSLYRPLTTQPVPSPQRLRELRNSALKDSNQNLNDQHKYLVERLELETFEFRKQRYETLQALYEKFMEREKEVLREELLKVGERDMVGDLLFAEYGGEESEDEKERMRREEKAMAVIIADDQAAILLSDQAPETFLPPPNIFPDLSKILLQLDQERAEQAAKTARDQTLAEREEMLTMLKEVEENKREAIDVERRWPDLGAFGFPKLETGFPKQDTVTLGEIVEEKEEEYEYESKSEREYREMKLKQTLEEGEEDPHVREARESRERFERELVERWERAWDLEKEKHRADRRFPAQVFKPQQ